MTRTYNPDCDFDPDQIDLDRTERSVAAEKEIQSLRRQQHEDGYTIHRLNTALREYQQRAEAAEKVVDHYLDEKNWEASPISGNAVLYVPAFLHGNAIAADYRIKYPKNAALTQDG